MTRLTIQETQLEEIIRRLAPGDEVVITENNQPVARLVSTAPQLAPRKIPRMGTLRGTVLSMEQFDDPLEDFGLYD